MTVTDQYKILGYFYQRGELQFRKHLDIINKDSKKTQPDLMVIMMNPGSSTQSSGYEKVFDTLVPAVLDPTLKHLIDVLSACNFEYARILNLSDVCISNSKDFKTYLKMQAISNPLHTIFHNDRKNELKELFVLDIPLIKAWGVDEDNRLRVLYNLADKSIQSNQMICGLANKKNRVGFYHPMRRKSALHPKSWSEQMIEMMQFYFN
ncbi:MAG: DUF1643 domain-containing protein [Chitinophagaceae bacterium]|nr:DUF1643 domain-containing protein [Chitinophagaceae bacterium]